MNIKFYKFLFTYFIFFSLTSSKDKDKNYLLKKVLIGGAALTGGDFFLKKIIDLKKDNDKNKKCDKLIVLVEKYKKVLENIKDDYKYGDSDEFIKYISLEMIKKINYMNLPLKGIFKNNSYEYEIKELKFKNESKNHSLILDKIKGNLEEIKKIKDGKKLKNINNFLYELKDFLLNHINFIILRTEKIEKEIIEQERKQEEIIK